MFQGCCFFVFLTLCIVYSQAQKLEDLDDLITAESSQENSRSARFLKLPNLLKRKIRIKKRLGPIDGHHQQTHLNPSVPRKRLHLKKNRPLPKRPQPPPVAKRQLGPVPPPQARPVRPLVKQPLKLQFKPQVKHQVNHQVKKQVKQPFRPKKLPTRFLNKKHLKNEIIRPQGPPQGPNRFLKKPVADERFFFGNRGRRRPRPSYKKKQPKRRPQHKRPNKYRLKPQAPKKTKAPKKTTTYKPTTKAPAPAYKPTEPSYEVEVTSYKPSEDVYQPAHDVDEFPDFPEPDFPDFMASFMPDFNFDINKINCKSFLCLLRDL